MRDPIVDEAELLRRYAAGERDFSGAQLHKAVLKGAFLHKADLSGADLSGAILNDAILRDSDLAGANLSGAHLTEANLNKANCRDADLSWAHLNGAHLAGARLAGANLRGANLSRARMGGAHLDRAHLRDVNLREANLREASLTGACLIGANLQEASLDRADLAGANLAGAALTGTYFFLTNIIGADFSGARLSGSILLNMDLSSLCRSELAHGLPSSVDYRSVLRSLAEPNLQPFLRDTGMPEVFVQFMVDCARSLNPNMVFSLLQSTFISYGAPDEAFAQKLNRALKKEGVTTFFFKDNAVPGDELHSTMRKGVNDHDRVILICSEASLNRYGVLNEIKETLRREARDGGRSYLIPVALDDYLFNGWQPSDPGLDPKAVTSRVAADFRDKSQFKGGIAKLILALKKT